MIPALYTGGLLSALLGIPVQAETTWHFPTPISANAFVTKHHVKFAEKLELATAGELKLVVHAGGSLYKAADILRAVRTGQVPIGSTGLFLHSAEEPLFALTNLPFLVKNTEDIETLITLSRPAFEAALKKKNLKLIYRAIWNPQGLFSAKPLLTPDDLKGMRIRTYDKSTTRVVQLANAIPTKTEPSEIALAFSTAVIDSSFGSGVTGVSQKLWDYIDYFYTTNSAFPTSSVVVNLEAWEKLDATTQATIQRIATETEKAIWSEVSIKEEQYNAAMRKAGMNVIDLSPELAAYFDNIGKHMASEWVKLTGAEGDKILRSLQGPH